MNEFKLNQYATTITIGTSSVVPIVNTAISINDGYYNHINTNNTNNISMGNVIFQSQFIFNKECAENMIKDSIKYLLKNSSSIEEIKSKIDKILDEEIILDILE